MRGTAVGALGVVLAALAVSAGTAWAGEPPAPDPGTALPSSLRDLPPVLRAHAGRDVRLVGGPDDGDAPPESLPPVIVEGPRPGTPTRAANPSSAFTEVGPNRQPAWTTRRMFPAASSNT